MATNDVLITIDKSDNSKMCKQSSNKIDLQISSPSNFNPHIKIEVIEGELVNSIRKPRTKSLEQDPNQLCRMSVGPNNWSLYKVRFPLREVNPKAYEPNLISIGPYHHGKKRLETMEVIKRNCFSMMIEKSKVEAEKFVIAMKKLEKRVRRCYEEPLDRFDSDTLVEMMVLDGCFIVLLFVLDNYLWTSLLKLKEDIIYEIYGDLLLLENQLPFFVLSKLYGVINMSNDEMFPRLALYHLSNALIPGSDICLPKKFPKKINHLLGLVHSNWLPSARKRHDAEAEAETEEETEAEIDTEAEAETETEAEAETKAEAETEAEIEAEAQSLWKFSETKPEEKGTGRKGERSRNFIGCATELEAAGIKFVKKRKDLQDKKGKASLFDIDFTEDGKLKIPTLSIDDDTERILRNFMAYEHFFRSEPTYVWEYVVFMDNLINSGKDVQLLCNCGIIDNWLGDDEIVAQMFNKLRDFTYASLDFDDFYYAEIFDKVNDHCIRPWNKRKAELKKDYFNSPWSTISVLAAFVLLLLTLLQTIFSVLSYVHPK